MIDIKTPEPVRYPSQQDIRNALRPGVIAVWTLAIMIPTWVVFAVQFVHSFFSSSCDGAGTCYGNPVVVSWALVLWGLMAFLTLAVFLGALLLVGLGRTLRDTTTATR